MLNVNVINLNHRKDRLSHFDNEATEQRFEYKRWEAEVSRYHVRNGISRSHKNIVRWANNTFQDMVCICEDDCKFTSLNGWDYFISNIPANFDIYLGGISTGEVQSDKTVNDFSGLHLYIVHSRFYDTFLSVPEHKDIDRAMTGLGKFVVSSPMVAIQMNDYSDHQRAVQDYTKYWSKYSFMRD